MSGKEEGPSEITRMLRTAVRAMHRILIEHARKLGAKKRGSGRPPGSLECEQAAGLPDLAEIVAVDEALSRMEKQNPRGAEIVRLRYFAGLDVNETAAALKLSPRTVRCEWLYARAELYKALRGENRETGGGR